MRGEKTDGRAGLVVSKKVATILELDFDNPFVEILEIKKNKTFVAKKSNPGKIQIKATTKMDKYPKIGTDCKISINGIIII